MELREIIDLLEVQDIYSLLLNHGKIDFLDKVLKALLRADCSDHLKAHIFMYRSHCASVTHKESKSIDLSNKCLKISKHVGNDFLIYGSLLNLAATNAKQGDLETAINQFNENLELISRSKTLTLKEKLLNEINRAQAYLRHGKYKEGIKCLDDIKDAIFSLKDQPSVYFSEALIRAQLYFQSNQIDKSIEVFKEIVETSHEKNNLKRIFISKCYLSYGAYLQNNIEIARSLHMECKASARELGSQDNIYYIWCSSILDCHFQGSDIALVNALSAEKKVLKQCKLNHAFYYRCIANILIRSGEIVKSQKYLNQACKIYRELEVFNLLEEISQTP